MTNEQAFLQSIYGELDDDVSRLVYCDWLEDQGKTVQPAFIRAQCEASRHPDYSAAHIAAMHAARNAFSHDMDLLEEGKPEIIPLDWRYSSVDLGAMESFHRGFIHKINISGDEIDRVAAQMPTVQYVYTQMGRGECELDHLLESPLMQRLQGLCLCNNMGPQAEDVREFLGDHRLGGLQELSFRNYQISAEALNEAAVDPSHFDNIRTLSFNTGRDVSWQNQDANNPGYRDFLLRLAGPEFAAHAQPRKLELKDLHLSSEDWQVLLHSDFTKNLTELKISGCGVTPEILDSILHSPRAAQLKSLSVTYSQERNNGHSTLAEIFSGISLPALEHLDLAGKPLDFSSHSPEELSRLLMMLDAPRLRNFDCTLDHSIRANNLPDAQTAIRSLLTHDISQKFPYLEVLNITRACTGALNEFNGDNTSLDTITRFAMARRLAEIRQEKSGAFPNLAVLNDTPVPEIDLSLAAQNALRDPARNQRF